MTNRGGKGAGRVRDPAAGNPPAAGAPPPGASPWPAWMRAPGRIEAAGGVIDAAAAAAAWRRCWRLPGTAARRCRSPRPTCCGPTCWQNSDKLHAVIDLGRTSVEDPAADVIAAWSVFAPHQADASRAALGVDDGAWSRARGYAPAPGRHDHPVLRRDQPEHVAQAGAPSRRSSPSQDSPRRSRKRRLSKGTRTADSSIARTSRVDDLPCPACDCARHQGLPDTAGAWPRWSWPPGSACRRLRGVRPRLVDAGRGGRERHRGRDTRLRAGPQGADAGQGAAGRGGRGGRDAGHPERRARPDRAPARPDGHGGQARAGGAPGGDDPDGGGLGRAPGRLRPGPRLPVPVRAGHAGNTGPAQYSGRVDDPLEPITEGTAQGDLVFG